MSPLILMWVIIIVISGVISPLIWVIIIVISGVIPNVGYNYSYKWGL